MAIRGPAQCFGHLIDGLELGQDAVPDVRAPRPRRALEPCLQEDGDHQVLTHGASPDSDSSESGRSLRSTEERPDSGRKLKAYRQVTGQTRGQELRGKNDEELGPGAWATVKLTDSAARLAALVARVAIALRS